MNPDGLAFFYFTDAVLQLGFLGPYLAQLCGDLVNLRR
jgi:hypothetical protein